MDFKYSEEYTRQLCEEKDLEFIGFSYKVFDKQRRCVDFICNKHRNWGVQTRPVEKLTYKQPCQYCNHKLLKYNFKEEVEQNNPDVEVLGDFVHTDQHILCKCRICGNEWMAHPRSILYLHEGCPTCGNIKKWDSRGRITTDEFKRRMLQINPDIEIIGEYKGSHELIKCRCKKCGVEWESYACNLQNQSAGCPLCPQSLGEQRMMKLLKDKGRNVRSQYVFKDCVYKQPLRFDAYDIDQNIAYEYQGQQHYYPVSFYGDKEKAQEQFEEGLIRDKIKVDYCKEHNITLVTIPYWDFDDMERYII